MREIGYENEGHFQLKISFTLYSRWERDLFSGGNAKRLTVNLNNATTMTEAVK